MQFDALTAGTALILVQFSVSLVMAGLFFALPTEKCTRHWALSGLCVGIGLTMVIVNAGAPRYLILILGNNLLILGLIYQWTGLRAFYRRPPSKAGWIVGGLFFMAYALSLIQNATISVRGLLAAIAIFLMLLLYMYELLSAQVQKWSFARLLATTAVAALLISYGGRVALAAFQVAEILPRTNSLISVTLLYFVPVVGTLLLSSALLLLYFERIVADKDHLATHDELTKVFNRRAIDTSGQREISVARRLRKPMAIAFVDIDHFKEINDRFGHAVGDRVLFQVAQALKGACRDIDLIGRYGGEEFCIIFPNMDMEKCHVVGQRLVSAVNQCRFEIAENVTISVGIALSRLDDEKHNWGILIERADHELYKAKSGGRNRFEVHADASTAGS
ncbi:GGDEF domain-containing protein [Janthinobacterium sp. 17J80-10]|uniref:GGDEF domain-containing protein n=1 Tax=Janthinobacterium sp. 17J80-10 TaxID=2497863 RepID=UPI001005A6FE|nr:GGDEF domain-containing protein [Janthinobacterium sp. 17J80-10]QAU34532.1 GGDEF domain-containing protein [Janthinobacterium sp. 17J80-10]